MVQRTLIPASTQTAKNAIEATMGGAWAKFIFCVFDRVSQKQKFKNNKLKTKIKIKTKTIITTTSIITTTNTYIYI